MNHLKFHPDSHPNLEHVSDVVNLMADNNVICLGGDSADTLSSLEINQLLDSGILDSGQASQFDNT